MFCYKWCINLVVYIMFMFNDLFCHRWGTKQHLIYENPRLFKTHFGMMMPEGFCHEIPVICMDFLVSRRKSVQKWTIIGWVKPLWE